MPLFGAIFGSMNFVTIAFPIMEKIQKQKPPKTVIRKNTKFFQSECKRARRNRRALLHCLGQLEQWLVSSHLKNSEHLMFHCCCPNFGSENVLHDRVDLFLSSFVGKTKWAWRHLALFLRTNRNPSNKNNNWTIIQKYL